MKIGVIEDNRKIELSITALLEILGFQPIAMNGLKNINPKEIRIIILNTKSINEKNKHFLISFLKNSGKIILYGKPSKPYVLKEIFNIEIIKINEEKIFGYIENNFIKDLQKNKYFDERKIPFIIHFLIKWRSSKEFGKITTEENKSAIIYINKFLNGYAAYIVPDIFETSYSLLTDQNDKYRSGIFKRKFPIDGLLYVYCQVLHECINKLFRDDIIVTKWYWPNKHLSAISLTHDIDTEYCSKDGLKALRKIEKKYKISSVWFFRPGDRYNISKQIVKKLLKEGCEVALHSIEDAIKDQRECKRQKRFIEKITGNKIFGVRSHALNRIPNTTQETDKVADFIYESTIPDTDNCIQNQKFKGNTIFFPYNYYFVTGKDLVILPLTIHDWWYISGNRWSDKKTMKFYLEKTDYIIRRHGLNMVLIHPALRLHLINTIITESHRNWMYDKYLRYIKKNPRLWISNADLIAKWTIMRKNIRYDYKYDNNKLVIQIDDVNEKDETAVKNLSLLISGNRNINKIEVWNKNHRKIYYEVEKFSCNKRFLHIIGRT